MIREKELRENNYKFYVLYRNLGEKSIQVDGFNTGVEMLEFIIYLEGENAIIYDLMTSY